MHGPQRGTFLNRRFIKIDEELCVGCSRCVQTCPLGNIIRMDERTGKAVVYNPMICAGCFKCVERCPSKAIKGIDIEALSDEAQDAGAITKTWQPGR